MIGWLHLTLVVISIVILLLFLMIMIRRWCCPANYQNYDGENRGRAENLQSGIARLHHVNLHNLDQETAKRTNYYVFRRGSSTKPLFSWSDNPSLVTDAVENGWSRFAFTTYACSPSVRSARSLLGVCTAGDRGVEIGVQISWEVCQGSADFMQKIRLNSGLNKLTTTNSSMAAAQSVIKTALPLPGPPLGNSAFPEEAYFEITVLFSHENDHELVGKSKENKTEGEKAKLIQENYNPKENSESSIHVMNNKKFEELKIGVKDEAVVALSVGLTAGGSVPLRLPGSYPGSIGFNSNGSVFLDGMKLVQESDKQEWGRGDRVIGCGYNPIQKKVFFTLDSELAHEIHCKSEEFGTPLYPTLAANTDITVVVNFGQSAFKYAPANANRTSNPCFIGPLANSPALGYDDSKELFSMGRIDSQWLNRNSTRNGHNSGISSGKPSEFDQESEGDLFEIVLDGYGRSPNTVL